MVIVGQGDGGVHFPSLETSSDTTEMDVYSQFFKKRKFSLLSSLDTINRNIISTHIKINTVFAAWWFCIFINHNLNMNLLLPIPFY